MNLAPQGVHYNHPLHNGGSLVRHHDHDDVSLSLHDLNTIDSRNSDIDGLTDADREEDAPTADDELDHDDNDSNSGGVSSFLLFFQVFLSLLQLE